MTLSLRDVNHSSRWRVDPRGYYEGFIQRTTIDVWLQIRPGLEAAIESSLLDLDDKHFIDAGLAVIADRWGLA